MSGMNEKQGTRARTQAARATAHAKAEAARARAQAARAGAERARRRARETAAQVTPLAASVRTTATQSLYRARIWAAPRLDQTGHAVQERVAPRVAGMLTAAARRVEPDRSRGRRWPMVAAGIAVLAAGSGAAAFLLNRRGQAAAHLGDSAGAQEGSSEQAGETAAADVNGQVRTP